MSMEDLSYYRNLIEIQTDLDPSMESVIAKLFPRLGDGVRWGLQALLNTDTRKRVLEDRERFLKLVQAEDYVSLGALGFAVPESMESDYLSFTSAIVDGLAHSAKLLETVILPFESILARVISDAKARPSVNPVDFKRIEDFGKARVTINKNIQSCFGTGLRSKIPYEKAIKRNADWDTVFANIVKMDSLSQVELKTVANKVTEVLELLDKIIDLAKENDFSGTNKTLVRNLANATQTVAEEVSFLNTVYYHMTSCKEALNTGMKDMIKNLN